MLLLLNNINSIIIILLINYLNINNIYTQLLLNSFPNVRPPENERTFTSNTVNNIINNLKPLFNDDDISILFSNCYPNTLDTTVYYYGESHEFNGLDSFIITGDIKALWLRDSTNQIIPYIPYILEDNNLKLLVNGLINRQSHSILIDSFANAFNYNNSGDGAQNDIRYPPMKNSVFEGKYELDSLCAFLKLSYWYYYYGNLTNNEIFNTFNDNWFNAINKLIETINIMIITDSSTQKQPYLFQRLTTVATDTLMMSGKGPISKQNGLSRQLFRPSDDSVTLPYNIPGNAMACTELNHLIIILNYILKIPNYNNFINITININDLIELIINTKNSICNTLLKEFENIEIIPYEIDGLGSKYYMDDANIPSLLSLPILGYINKLNPLYISTRNYVLSINNPFYFVGPEGHGIGGPHEGYNLTWPMAIITTIMTSTNDLEILNCLNMLKRSARRTGLMHEAFNVNNVNDYTRSWFAWANGLFGEMILQLIITKPHLIIKNDPSIIKLAQSYIKNPISLQAQLETIVT